MKRERLDELDELLGDIFRPDFLARLQGKILYRAQASEFSEEKLNEITRHLIEKGFIPHLEKRNG